MRARTAALSSAFTGELIGGRFEGVGRLELAFSGRFCDDARVGLRDLALNAGGVQLLRIVGGSERGLDELDLAPAGAHEVQQDVIGGEQGGAEQQADEDHGAERGLVTLGAGLGHVARTIAAGYGASCRAVQSWGSRRQSRTASRSVAAK